MPDRPLTPPPRLPDALATRLGRVQRQAARSEFLRAGGLGLALATLVLALTAGLVGLRVESARAPGWFVAIALVVAGAGVGLVRAHRARRDNRLAARLLGALHPYAASDLLSAVELADSSTSSSLVRAHLERMGEEAARLDAGKAVRAKPAVLACVAAVAGVLLHIGLLSLSTGRLGEAWSFLFFRPFDEGTLFAPEPIAGDIKLTYRYPAHTGRPPKTVEGTAGDILAPKGTVVEIEARADRDVERAFIVYDGTVAPLRVEGRALSGELIVGASGEWRLRYGKTSGRIVAEGPARPVGVETDRAPSVTLSAPEPELEVDGNERLLLSFEATDDYGLGELRLVWSRGDGTEERKTLETFGATPPRRHRGETTWDLGPLGLGPGDRVTYRVEALDNDSVSGAKTGTSPTQVLKVFSKVEHNHEILRRAQEQWERLIAGLADRLVEPRAGARGEGADDAWRALTRDHDETLASVAHGLSELGRELAADERAPQEIGLALGNVGHRVGQAVGKTVEARRALLALPNADRASRLAQALDGEIREEEQGVLYLEDLFDRQRLLDLAELSRELQAARRELSSLVEAYKNEPSDEAKRELMAELSRLKQRVHELFRRMQELQKQIQDRHLNEDAAETMNEGRDLLSELDDIQEKLARGETDEALKALEDLQKQLEKMERQFNEGAGETSPEMQELGRELQAFASDLMDVEAEQKAIQQETRDLQSARKEEQRKRLDALGEAFVKKQRERVQRAAKELERIDPNVADALVFEDELLRAVERLAQLDQALEGGEFDEALEQAEQALNDAELIARRLDIERRARERVPAWRNDMELGPAAQHAERATPPLNDVVRDLSKLMKDARPTPSDAERQKLESLAKRQNDAQKRTNELGERLEEIGKKAPLFGPEEMQMLGEAEKKMGEAQTKLGDGDARGADSPQGKALEKLQAMRDAMQDAANQQGEGGAGGGIPMPFARSNPGGDGQGQGMKQDKVEIPRADESRGPEAFRKDIMDAMKDDAPDAYRERVRDYYQELVK